MNIENHNELKVYLEESVGFLRSEIKQITNLSGGVSNRIVRVDRINGESIVVKQALEKLRVPGEWHCHPSRIFREIEGGKWLRKSPQSVQVPPVLFDDNKNYMFGMEAVKEPFLNLKEHFIFGKPNENYFSQAGEILSKIHSKATVSEDSIPKIFYNQDFFNALRINPFYEESAKALTEHKDFFYDLINETLSDSFTIVHGDFSPKNFLVKNDKLILLDHEVIHFGDGTFDIGFFTAHLMSKANHIPKHWKLFLKGIKLFFSEYNAIMRLTPKREQRAVNHSIACFIARVTGLSQVDYLNRHEKMIQKKIGIELLKQQPKTMREMVLATKKLFQMGYA